MNTILTRENGTVEVGLWVDGRWNAIFKTTRLRAAVAMASHLNGNRTKIITGEFKYATGTGITTVFGNLEIV